jgi:hypothetical protein
MLVMMHDFFSWDPEEQSKQLDYLTRITSFDGKPTYMNAWDITELSPEEGRGGPSGGPTFKSTLKPYEEDCMQPKDKCYPSVMFLDNCHNPQVVNYVQWGVLARLNEWKKGGSANSYEDTWFSTYHDMRSGYGPAGRQTVMAPDQLEPPDYTPQPSDPNFPDQVAMANVGWKLADDYVARWSAKKSEYKLNQINRPALKALLVMLENKGRSTAICQKCAEYHSFGPQNQNFSYVFGERIGDYHPLKDL